jgi:hypothetical protein
LSQPGNGYCHRGRAGIYPGGADPKSLGFSPGEDDACDQSRPSSIVPLRNSSVTIVTWCGNSSSAKLISVEAACAPRPRSLPICNPCVNRRPGSRYRLRWRKSRLPRKKSRLTPLLSHFCV